MLCLYLVNVLYVCTCILTYIIYVYTGICILYSRIFSQGCNFRSFRDLTEDAKITAANFQFNIAKYLSLIATL